MEDGRDRGKNDLNLAYGALFFAADDGIHGNELWRSDGSEEGTFLVKDINPGPDPSDPLESPGDNPVLFFDADDGLHGFELWTSDGTEAGTVLVKDIVPGPGSSRPGRAYEVQGAFVFDANDGIHGRELWRTDGTAEGTLLLKNISAGGHGLFSPGPCVRIADTLFFEASDGVSGDELWKTDGTEAGTVLVKDIVPGRNGSEVRRLTPVGETLFFTADVFPDPLLRGFELWKSDGTEAGTVIVKAIRLEGGSNPDALAGVDGTLFFTAGHNEEAELWRSDGTEVGTVLVQDLALGPFSSLPGGFALAGSRLFFAADDVVLGRELWVGRASILAGRPRRAIEELGEEVEDAGLPSGIERSLTSKLRAAAEALDRRDGNPAAVRLLQAFVQELERLDGGADLLQFAQEILDLLAGEFSSHEWEAPRTLTHHDAQ